MITLPGRFRLEPPIQRCSTPRLTPLNEAHERYMRRVKVGLAVASVAIPAGLIWLVMR